MRALYNDIANEGTLSSYNLVGGYDIDALVDSRLARYANFTYYSGITIVLTFAVSHTLDSVGLAGHEFTDALQVSVNGSAAESFGQDGTGYVTFGTPITATVFTIVLTDSGIDNGSTISIGRLIVGTNYVFPDVNYSLTEETRDTSQVSFSATHQAYGSSGATFASINVNLPAATDAEKAEINTFIKTVHNYIPFILDFNETNYSGGPYYCVLANDGATSFQYNTARRWLIVLTFEEVN